jgi:AraC-like DNA-binding protein
MTLTISEEEYNLWCEHNPPFHNYNLVLDNYEILSEQPKNLGQHGYIRSMELLPGIELDILNWRSDRDLILKMPTHEHEIQLFILTSGYNHHDQIYPTIGGKRGYLSGSGIAPACQLKFSSLDHFTGIDIHLKPEVLSSLFPHFQDSYSTFAKVFLKQNEWKKSFFPEVTPSMQIIVKQIMNTPYQGITRRLYLQAKVLELLAMQLNIIILEFEKATPKLNFKAQSIDRIYQVRDILLTRLDNPPSILELTQQVGIGELTLRRGFRKLFGTTIVGYLIQKRMEQAEQLLREKQLSVAEVANLVGYSHLGYFAKVFKRQFGITPTECLEGKLFQE